MTVVAESRRELGAGDTPVWEGSAVVGGDELDPTGAAVMGDVLGVGGAGADEANGSAASWCAEPAEVIGVMVDANDEPLLSAEVDGRAQDRVAVVSSQDRLDGQIEVVAAKVSMVVHSRRRV